MPADASGIRELARALRKAGGDVKRQAGQALGRVTSQATADMRGSVARLTGETAASITSTGAGLDREIKAGGAALYLEHGTSRMAPQPFMGPAIDRAESSLVEQLERTVGGAL